jgi:hypothetical protein
VKRGSAYLPLPLNLFHSSSIRVMNYCKNEVIELMKNVYIDLQRGWSQTVPTVTEIFSAEENECLLGYVAGIQQFCGSYQTVRCHIFMLTTVINSGLM